MEIKKDQVLMREGEPSDFIYVLVSGELSILKYNPKDKRHEHIAYIMPGEMVGEMSFLENEPRFATVKASTDCVVEMMNRATFEKLLSSQLPLIRNLVKTLSQRVREATKKIIL